jgi:membrane protease YdiL (CAAX protease family)
VKNLDKLLEPSPDELVQSLLWLLGIAVLGCVAAGGFCYWRSRHGQALPPQRQRAVPWSGWDVCASWIVYWFAISVTFSIFATSGVLANVYGPDFLSLLKQESPAGEIARNRAAVWATVAAFPLQLLGVIYTLRSVSGTQLYQIGWTTHRLSLNIQLGVLAWMILQPLVLAGNVLVTVLYKAVTDASPRPHALEQLARHDPLGIDWCLVVFTAVVVAPVMEELLCRGILQPWAAKRPAGANMVMVVTFLVALGFRLSELARPFEQREWGSLFMALQPAAFVLLMLPGYLLVRYYFRSQTGGAIFASALLFGSIHNNWPTPIPLFGLGLGLGWLAYRTQSLVGPMTLHMLFNGVACLTLMLSQEEPTPSNGSPTTEAVRCPPSSPTWTVVPGSQLPRRR